ncbi:hypothetical protein DNHGIG_30700 [Collibacillus ludicampi]|uniref:YicC family protein n=1 Tax=Collibacillus ludicampi TaxID=2771369 RepID=A0AAV4LIC8_9BACL|nr:YicC/YloC family endoribonuclease [Collibacillus ludicampi]GIM47521.1 hypothetical protein DNHGIG_30700 [Collibacillus ludicampi]
MIKSMTGYGRAELSMDGYRATVEIKAVNHRYCDIVFRMPREYLSLEDSLKKIVASRVKRGRLDVYITVEKTATDARTLSVDTVLAERLKNVADELSERLGIDNDMSVSDLLQFPELLRIEEEEADQEITGSLLQQCVSEALEALVQMRLLEGQRLQRDFENRLEVLKEIVARMEVRSPQTVLEYKQKLETQMRDLLSGLTEVDHSRLLMEVALMADRVNIEEELVRLKSHISQFADALKLEEPIGRKLDFIVQEMNREFNTIGSKANDFSLSASVVEAKSVLEQIREQVQNVE